MAALNYNPHHKTLIDSFLLDLPGITTSNMFGLPCYKIDNVIFATLWGEGIGLKLPEVRVAELRQQPDFAPFQPFGRDRGQQFVQINHQESQDYEKDKALFLESMAYVAYSGKPTKKQGKSKANNKTVESEETFFRGIAEAIANEHTDVTWGKMMSSPGIKYKDKFFAFYDNKTIVVRFGREFKPETIGISDYTLLAPFKTKLPLLDWFRISASDQDRWQEAAKIALQRMAVK